MLLFIIFSFLNKLINELVNLFLEYSCRPVLILIFLINPYLKTKKCFLPFFINQTIQTIDLHYYTDYQMRFESLD